MILDLKYSSFDISLKSVLNFEVQTLYLSMNSEALELADTLSATWAT